MPTFTTLGALIGLAVAIILIVRKVQPAYSLILGALIGGLIGGGGLVGTGTVAGIIKASALQTDVISVMEAGNLPAFLLAPAAGILIAAASASTTAGATIASQTFAPTLTGSGVPALEAAAMIHAGATVADSLPHGSFFHATGGAVNLSIKERMRLIPYEAVIGLTSTVVSVILYLI